MVCRREDLADPLTHRWGNGLADVEHLPGHCWRIQGGQHGPGDVGDVDPGPTPGALPDGDASPAGAYSPQDELLTPLHIAFAIDHPQPQHDSSALQIKRFDVELVVTVHVDVVTLQAEIGAPVRIPTLAQRGILAQRHGDAGLTGQRQLICAIHIHAGQHYQRHLGKVWQHSIGISPGHRQGVHHRVRREGPDLIGDAAELAAVDVEMPAWHPVLRLGHTTVYDEHFITATRQCLGDPPTDEPGAPDDDNAHGHIITP